MITDLLPATPFTLRNYNVFGLALEFDLQDAHRKLDYKTIMHLRSQHTARVQSSIQLTWLSA